MRGGGALNLFRVITAAALLAAAVSSLPAQESSPPEPEGTGLADALAGPTGVRVATMCTNCNVAAVTLSGQGGDAVQVWQDGLPVMGGLGAIYLLSVLPSPGIARTEIVRGAGTVLSGSEAAAGALVLETREPGREPFLHALLDVGGLDWGSQKLFASGSRGRLGGDLVVTHARSDGSDPNGDGNFDLGEFDRTTVGASGRWELSDRSDLRAGVVNYEEDQRGSKGGYKGASDPIQPGHFYAEDIDIRRIEYDAGWDLEFEGGARLSVNGRYADRDQETSDTSDTPQPYMVVHELARLFEARYERTVFSRHVLTAGATSRNFDVSGRTVKRSVLHPDGQEIADFIHHQGAYAQVDLSLPARWSLTAGARWDTYDLPAATTAAGVVENDRARISPRLRVAWKATPELSLALSAGYGFTPPRPIFERVCCGATVQSNANVRTEVSRNLLLDTDWVPRRFLRLRASAFRTDADDYIQKISSFASPNFIPSYQQVNYDRATLQGADLSVETRLAQHFTAGVQGTHLRAVSDGPLFVFPLPDLLPGFSYQIPAGPLPYMPEDTATVSLGWDDPATGLKLSAQGQYTGSMNIQELPSFGAVTAFVATPSFWTVNLRGEIRVLGGLSAFLGVDNVGNETQLWLDDPRYEYNWGPLRGRYVYGGIMFEWGKP